MVGKTEADGRPARNKGRPVLHLARRLDGGPYRIGIVTVNFLGMPVRGAETRGLIVRNGQTCRPVDRHGIIVEKGDQLSQPQMACQRNGLVADPLHEAAVTHEDIGMVVDKIVREACIQKALRERKSYGICETLSQGTGRRFDAWDVPVLGVTRSLASDLSESLDPVDVDPVIADEIEQHATMAV